MKIAILCLCLLTITFAHPVRKPRHHDDGSMSAEGRHDSREHRHHAHKHHHHDSHSQEHSQEYVHSHESQEQQVSSQLSAPSSEESEEITEQQTLLVPAAASKSVEDDDNHSDVDDDDDDHSDSDDSDESHEGTVTDFPTDSPFTPPVPPDPFTGRGDSAPYRIRAKVDLVHFKKSYKESGKFDSHDITDDFDSTPDVESHESYSSKAHSLESHDTSVESDLRESNEVHSTSHDRSLEKVSQQTLESVEDDHDDGDHDNSKITASLESHESTELQKDYHDGLQQVAHDRSVDDVSNQTLESAEDHHSVEDRHSAEDNHSVEDHSIENHRSVENHSTEDHHSVEDHHSIEDNEVTL